EEGDDESHQRERGSQWQPGCHQFRSHVVSLPSSTGLPHQVGSLRAYSGGGAVRGPSLVLPLNLPSARETHSLHISDSSHSRSMPTRLSRKTTPSRGGTDTWLGIAIVTQPASAAEVSPTTESSTATHRPGSTPSLGAARRLGSGCGLFAASSSPATVSPISCSPMLVMDVSIRLRPDEATRQTGTGESASRRSSSCAPGRTSAPSANMLRKRAYSWSATWRGLR